MQNTMRLLISNVQNILKYLLLFVGKILRKLSVTVIPRKLSKDPHDNEKKIHVDCQQYTRCKCPFAMSEFWHCVCVCVCVCVRARAYGYRTRMC